MSFIYFLRGRHTAKTHTYKPITLCLNWWGKWFRVRQPQFLLQTKLNLLVLNHQVTDVANRKVTKQLDVMTSDLIEELWVPIPIEDGGGGGGRFDDQHKTEAWSLTHLNIYHNTCSSSTQITWQHCPLEGYPLTLSTCHHCLLSRTTGQKSHYCGEPLLIKYEGNLLYFLFALITEIQCFGHS